MQYIVLLRCGHWFREGRPEDLASPVNGELRVCADLKHYPERYEAFYWQTQPKIVTEWIENRASYPLATPGHWEETFRIWWLSEGHSPENSEGRRLAAEAWKAALVSVFSKPKPEIELL